MKQQAQPTCPAHAKIIETYNTGRDPKHVEADGLFDPLPALASQALATFLGQTDFWRVDQDIDPFTFDDLDHLKPVWSNEDAKWQDWFRMYRHPSKDHYTIVYAESMDFVMMCRFDIRMVVEQPVVPVQPAQPAAQPTPQPQRGRKAKDAA